MTAEEVIRKLDLKPLPEEGGFFRETYKSSGPELSAEIFGISSQTKRRISTAIYYLVIPESFSTLHRIKSDEVFHFYAGDPVEMIQLTEAGKLSKFILGGNILKDETPQVVVPKGVWQGLKLKPGGAWALMGTTVSPGFEFEDFELGDREKMSRAFPNIKNDIKAFTRGSGD